MISKKFTFWLIKRERKKHEKALNETRKVLEKLQNIPNTAERADELMKIQIKLEQNQIKIKNRIQHLQESIKQ